jgi:hypothetical protein
MTSGTVEAWSLGNQDSQRHLREGADLARQIGRPYLEVACLAELAFASKIEPPAIRDNRLTEAVRGQAAAGNSARGAGYRHRRGHRRIIHNEG